MRLKAVRITAAILSLLLLLTGCSNFRLSSSIDDLISPIAPSGDNAGIQSAVDKYCSGGYSIKIPSYGDYTTSFILKDIDGDKQNEAVAFYEPSDKLGTICMALLKKSGDTWSVLDNVERTATDINSVNFCDLDNDGALETIVCWSVVSKTAGTSICVYSQETESDGAVKLKSLSKAISGSDFICVDINDDSVIELLVFATGTASENPRAELYSFESGSRRLIGETRLDSTITSFENITYAKTDEGTSVYADAVCADGSSTITEFIYWSDYYNSIISPFYSYSTGRTRETLRSGNIYCRDIDGDGTVEIPKDASKKQKSTEITAQNWESYGNTVLSHKCYSFACKRDGYIILIDDADFDNLTYEYDNNARTLRLIDKKDKKTAAEIITVIGASYDKSDAKYSGYTNIFTNSGMVYLAKTSKTTEVNISTDTLKNMIKIY